MSTGWVLVAIAVMLLAIGLWFVRESRHDSDLEARDLASVRELESSQGKTSEETRLLELMIRWRTDHAGQLNVLSKLKLRVAFFCFLAAFVLAVLSALLMH